MQPAARVAWDDTRWKVVIDGSVALTPVLYMHLSDMARLKYTTYLEVVLVRVLPTDCVLEVQSLWTQRAHESAVVDRRFGQATRSIRDVGHLRVHRKDARRRLGGR